MEKCARNLNFLYARGASRQVARPLIALLSARILLKRFRVCPLLALQRRSRRWWVKRAAMEAERVDVVSVTDSGACRVFSIPQLSVSSRSPPAFRSLKFFGGNQLLPPLQLADVPSPASLSLVERGLQQRATALPALCKELFSALHRQGQLRTTVLLYISCSLHANSSTCETAKSTCYHSNPRTWTRYNNRNGAECQKTATLPILPRYSSGRGYQRKSSIEW